jgi:hypothetical protein
MSVFRQPITCLNVNTTELLILINDRKNSLQLPTQSSILLSKNIAGKQKCHFDNML